MALYENILIARQDISPAQAEQLAESMAAVVRDNGGKVTKTEMWGLRTLAYKINKNRKGHYVLMNLDAPPAAVKELERTMRINEDIIRFLTVRVEKLEDGPSVMMQARNERGDRSSGPRRDFDRPFRGPREEMSDEGELA
ncbi:MAG: 30S ribosomal protein S6 [Pseudomonadota bacterium]|nr:30S ribosomal protein S6 [Pseudomonadota bacterium]